MVRTFESVRRRSWCKTNIFRRQIRTLCRDIDDDVVVVVEKSISHQSSPSCFQHSNYNNLKDPAFWLKIGRRSHHAVSNCYNTAFVRHAAGTMILWLSLSSQTVVNRFPLALNMFIVTIYSILPFG
jgi:hypothetical protein